MSVGNIVTIIAANGMEYVGKMVAQDADGVVLDDPRMIVANDQGMGFANGIAMTGEKDPKRATFQQIILMTATNEEVVSAWRQATTGLITTPQQGVIL